MGIDIRKNLESIDIKGWKEKAIKAGNLIDEKTVRAKADLKKAGEISSKLAASGMEIVKKGTAAAAVGLGSSIEIIQEKSKDAQMSVLTYIDKKKNKRYIEAKLTAFEDGLKQGKIETAEYIKKFVDYYLAATALSCFFARCDGVSDRENVELNRILQRFLRNQDLPQNVKDAIRSIGEKEDFTFDEVKKYLDRVSVETVRGLSDEIADIINADGVISENEANVLNTFNSYLATREAENNG